MPAWYDIDFEMVPEREHPPHIHEAASLIEKCIEKEMEKYSTSSNHSRWIQSRSCSLCRSKR